MRSLIIDGYIIETPIMDIIRRIKFSLTNGKLRDIRQDADNIVVSCPFHKNGLEQKPAGNIYIGDDSSIPFGFFRCLACGREAFFEGFVAECFDATEAWAKKWLISNFNGQLASQKIKLADVIKLPKKSTNFMPKIDPKVLNKYQNWCPYLASRGLTRDICEKFEVKYDAANRQIVFPCYDTKNNLVMLATRAIDNKIFYLDKEVEKPVYGLNNIINNNIHKAIITEGPFDMLKGNMFGVPTIATLGTPSDTQIKQLNNSCLTVLYTMFDNDEAGKNFTKKLKKQLAKRILLVEIPIPEDKKDLGELSYEEFWNVFNKYAKN